jgi:hypothetical protein
MSDYAKATEPQFRLHVPLQTTQGCGLSIAGDGHLSVLGYPARLHQRAIFAPVASVTTIGQWLVFAPLPEKQARSLFDDLRLRLPVLSLRQGTTFIIPNSELRISPLELIPRLVDDDL